MEEDEDEEDVDKEIDVRAWSGVGSQMLRCLWEADVDTDVDEWLQVDCQKATECDGSDAETESTSDLRSEASEEGEEFDAVAWPGVGVRARMNLAEEKEDDEDEDEEINVHAWSRVGG